MANNYYDATGVLVLDQVTPVITALFGGLKLDASYPGNGEVYIAQIAEDSGAHWDDVCEDLVALAQSLGLSVPSEGPPTMDDVLAVLSRHFGTDQDEDLQHLIEHHRFEDDSDLDALFLIATCFDDDHHLVAIQLEGCWSCSPSRLFEFGGPGCFISRELTVSSESTHALQLGEELRTAILAGDLAAASNRIANETLALLAAITDDQVRARLRRYVADRLLTDPSLTAAD